MRKLNFGCGSNRPDDFENFDAEVDITKPLPFENDSVDFILAEHVVEHTSAPDTLRFFDECYRILKVGGTVRICVPEVKFSMTLEHQRDLVFGHGHLQVLNFQVVDKLLRMAGFKSIGTTPRKDCDGHWRAIGKEKDALETLRAEAFK